MKKKVFMVMPFSNEIAKSAYDYSIKSICEKHNLDIRRADEIFTTNPVYEDIVKEIRDASIIIVDVSDNNPNVYYELGMAHTLKQNQTIIITQGDFNNTPFDISHFRIIKYQDSIQGKEKLEKQLDLTLKSLLTDYKSINRDKYELTFEIFYAGKKQNELATLIGIRNYVGIVKNSDNLDIEFEFSKDSKTRQRTSVITNTKTLTQLNYLKENNDIVDLTEEGKAFAELVEEKGIICHVFNDQTFTKDYKSFEEEYWEKEKKKKIKMLT
jgi:dihydroxyacetone kinase-like predicted kinase